MLVIMCVRGPAEMSSLVADVSIIPVPGSFRWGVRLFSVATTDSLT